MLFCALLCSASLFISLAFVGYFKFALNERLSGLFIYTDRGCMHEYRAKGTESMNISLKMYVNTAKPNT